MTTPIARTYSRDMAIQELPRRKPGAHKWSVGATLIVAGSPGYVGAPALAAMAAGRVGAGVVHLVVPRSLIGAIAGLVPETVFLPIPDGELGSGDRLIKAIDERAQRCNSFLIGPGIGNDDYARQLIDVLLGLTGTSASRSFGFGRLPVATRDKDAPDSLIYYGRPIVVDADGLNALAHSEGWWERVPEGSLILTPHAGELSRLTGEESDVITADSASAAWRAAIKFRQTVVLKGNPTHVASPPDVWTGPETPLSLASAGTGDVLAGAIAGLIAQGMVPRAAANLALLAGANAARSIEADLGVAGLVASDLPIVMARELAQLARS
jgi:NAD(P)H-hydrate repair Nnr-like enzyme with NAD(P)H-hydrate dehydratase domain